MNVLSTNFPQVDLFEDQRRTELTTHCGLHGSPMYALNRRGARADGGDLVFEQRQEFAEGMTILEWMAKVCVLDDRVAVPATNTLVSQAVCGFKLGDDALHCTLGNSDKIGNLALANIGVASDGQENVSVVGEELPRRRNFHSFTIDSSCLKTRTLRVIHEQVRPSQPSELTGSTGQIAT